MTSGFKDHFSKQAADYAKFRPRYPQTLFEYLGSIAPSRQLAWDCATGSGQAAIELAEVFAHVIATDASEQQIANAEPQKCVEYRVATAEDSGLETGSVDLVMVAQALHWFDLDRFYTETNRVLKPRGVIAVSAYRFFHIAPAIDDLVSRRYYRDIVGPFWPPERRQIEEFEEIPFPFPHIHTPAFEMTVDWSLDHLIGYLWTWSATQRYIAANGRDPIEEIRDDLLSAWGEPAQRRRIAWPLTLRAGMKPS